MADGKEYKSERKNPRRLQLWDTAYLYDAMQAATELRAGIEKLAQSKDTSIEQLDATVIDTDMLYMLADAYVDSYNRLLKEALITTGNISKISPTIN